MGGNLYHFGRLPAAPYRRLEARVRPVLDEVFGVGGWRIPHSHRDKADFGDLDILVSDQRITPETLALFRESLGITEHQAAKPVHSHALLLQPDEQAMGQDHFQVDLFATPPELLTVRHDFMSWGDCGNIIARMAKPWNLKWGQDGLEYVHRLPDNNYYQGELLLSRHIERLLRLLELDTAHYHAGFASEREMFEWVMASPQFSPRPYQRAAGLLAKKSRIRPGMERFRTLVIERYGMDIPERQPTRDPAPYFPEVDLPAWIEQENAKQAELAIFKAKFNGEVVVSLRPELNGKALGRFMQQIRSQEVSGLKFDVWVLQTTADELAAYIRAFEPE